MKLLSRWKSIIWTVLILVATTIPSSSIPKTPLLKIPHFDKVVHFVLFFVLAIFLISENNKLRKEGALAGFAIRVAIVVSIIYGLAIELLQYFFLSSRSGSLYDFAANVFGAILAVFLYRIVNKLTYRYL